MPQENKKRKHGALYAPVAFVLVCAALIFCLSVFFRVSAVEVEGNGFYSEQEIVDASGVHEGDNLFFINRFSVASRVFAKLPYIEGVSIERKLPGGIVISVTESEAIAYLRSGDELWAIDRSCKLLSQVKAEDAEALIRVEGMSAASPAEGDMLVTTDGNAAGVEYLSDMLGQIYALGLRQDIKSIDMTDPLSPEFDYVGRFTVRMGANENTPYKFQLMLGAVAALQSGDAGILDLSIDSAAHLTYE